MTVYKWSTTAATNDDVDSTINWQEGQSPASVNNSARAMMAAIAKWRDDMSGNVVTAGTSTAYTATSNQVFSALTDGISIALRMSADNGASPTLNVDGLGAKAIATLYGTAVGTGKLRSGAVYVFTYDSTDDKWIVHGNPNVGFESGTKLTFRQTAAPTGWTKDTTYNDAALRIVSGTIGQQATAGKEFTTLLASRTIAEANLPSHTHAAGTLAADSNGAHTHTLTNKYAGPFTFSGGTGSSRAYLVDASSANSGDQATPPTSSSNGAHTHTISGSTGNGSGSGTAMDFAVNYVDLILATRD